MSLDVEDILLADSSDSDDGRIGSLEVNLQSILEDSGSDSEGDLPYTTSLPQQPPPQQPPSNPQQAHPQRASPSPPPSPPGDASDEDDELTQLQRILESAAGSDSSTSSSPVVGGARLSTVTDGDFDVEAIIHAFGDSDEEELGRYGRGQPPRVPTAAPSEPSAASSHTAPRAAASVASGRSHRSHRSHTSHASHISHASNTSLPPPAPGDPASSFPTTSALAVKRRLLRSKLQGQSLSLRHRQAARSSGGRAAQGTGVVRVEPLDRLSEKLQRFASSLASGPGLPTCIAVHSKFIAIGTSRGLVMVFDHFQEVRGILKPKASSKEATGAVTAIDVSTGSDHLVCGYFGGKVILWDIMEGTELKVAAYHSAPITCVRFVADDAATVLSVDTSGFVNVLSFSKWFMWSVDCRCLLDGSRVGQIVAVARLDGLIALSSREVTLVVMREPSLKIVHRWDRPDDVPAGVLPCLAWGHARVHGSAAGTASVDAVLPVLARGWGPHLQLLQVQGSLSGRVSSPATFVVADDLDSTAPVHAVAWVSPSVLIYMTADHEVSVLDTLELTEVETFSVADLGMVYETYAAPGSEPGGAGGGDDDPGARAVARARAPASYQNSFRTCDESLFMLGVQECRRARLQSWTERVEALVDASEWLEALALSLDQYEAAAARHDAAPAPPAATAELNDRLERLLLSYVRLSLHVGQYATLAGVCVEFCVVCRRLDLLFDVIFERFAAEARADVLLDWLEPYILDGRITHLTPVVMKAFVEHYRDTGKLTTVERCLLHLDVLSLDIDTTVRLCLTHGLLSAFVYINNRGLLDYVSPVDVLLAHTVELPPGLAPGLTPCGTPGDRSAAGAILLHYLQNCFTGAGFPDGDVPKDAAADLVPNLLAFLFAHSPTDLPDAAAAQMLRASRAAVGARALAALPGPYPRVQALLMHDARLFLGTLACLYDRAAAEAVSGDGDGSPPAAAGPSLQSLVDALGEAVLPFAPAVEGVRREASPVLEKLGSGGVTLFSHDVVAAVFEFWAGQLSRPATAVTAPHDTVVGMIHFFAVRSSAGLAPVVLPNGDTAPWHAAVKRVLERRPLPPAAARGLLPVVEANGLGRIALVLSRQRGDVGRVLDCYIRDEEAGFRAQAFAFVRQVVEDEAPPPAPPGESSDEGGGGPPRIETQAIRKMKAEILSRLPRLIDVDQDETARLVVELFPQETDTVLAQLSNPRLQFQYLHQIMAHVGRKPGVEYGDVRGSARMEELLKRSNLEISAELRLRYIRLLCEYEPGAVYGYLSSHDEDPELLGPTLDLVQREFHITDATAYLLERTGDVTGALQLIMDSMTQALDAGDTDKFGGMLAVGAQLCARHSSSEGGDAQAQQLWFTVLDKLLQLQKDMKLAAGAGGDLPVDRAAALAAAVSHVQASMKGHIPLNVVLNKVIADHARSEFGEFRGTILGMLDQFSYEQRILRSANRLLMDDVNARVRVLHRGKARGLAAHGALRCARCGGALSDPPAQGSSRARHTPVFVAGCGHAFHVSCLGGGPAARTCPLCQQAVGGGRRRRTHGTSLSSDTDSDADDFDMAMGDAGERLRRLKHAKMRVASVELNVTAPRPPPEAVLAVRRRPPEARLG